MSLIHEIDPIPVHITGSAVELAPPARKKRRRRALRTNTYTLTSTTPVLAMPQADTRIEGWITSAIGTTPPVIFMSTSQAGAQAQGGGAAQISGTDTMPFPVNTTDQVWISAATGFPVTVSVVQIFEEDE